MIFNTNSFSLFSQRGTSEIVSLKMKLEERMDHMDRISTFLQSTFILKHFTFRSHFLLSENVKNDFFFYFKQD